MAAAATTPVLLSIDEYLRTSYKPDMDFVDGNLEERNLGEFDHARLQTILSAFFFSHERDGHITTVIEQRIRVSPTRVLERLLYLLLPWRDRETVSGDLLEAYRDQHRPGAGRFRAGLWYARQVFSFAPHRITSLPPLPGTLSLFCGFTALAGCWLGVMDFLLQHPGYAQREIISATIIGEALITLFVLHVRRFSQLRIIALGGSSGILYLGVGALVGVLRGAHFEGYILLIALALICQALLTIVTLARRSSPPEPKIQPI